MIQSLITMFKILIFCVRLAGELVSNWLCCLTFLSVVSFCRFHLSDGARCISRYMYGSFWVTIGKF